MLNPNLHRTEIRLPLSQPLLPNEEGRACLTLRTSFSVLWGEEGRLLMQTEEIHRGERLRMKEAFCFSPGLSLTGSIILGKSLNLSFSELPFPHL